MKKTIAEYVYEIRDIFNGVHKCDSDEFGNLCVICADGDGELSTNYGEYWDRCAPGWRDQKTDGMSEEEVEAFNRSVDRLMRFEDFLRYGRRLSRSGSCYDRYLDEAQTLNDVRDVLSDIMDEQTSGCNSVTPLADERFERAKKILEEIEAAIEEQDND